MQSHIGTTPEPYASTLSVDAARQGIELLQENAARLARDAKLLLNARRYPSAALMATMAIEELARLPILIDLAAAGRSEERSRLWCAFRGPASGYPWSVLQDATPPCSEEQLNVMLSFVRALGAAIDCLGAGTWASPQRLIGRDLAREIVATAELLTLHPIRGQALDIWLSANRKIPKTATDVQRTQRLAKAFGAAGLTDEVAALAALKDRLDADRARKAS